MLSKTANTPTNAHKVFRNRQGAPPFAPSRRSARKIGEGLDFLMTFSSFLANTLPQLFFCQLSKSRRYAHSTTPQLLLLLLCLPDRCIRYLARYFFRSSLRRPSKHMLMLRSLGKLRTSSCSLPIVWPLGFSPSADDSTKDSRIIRCRPLAFFGALDRFPFSPIVCGFRTLGIWRSQVWPRIPESRWGCRSWVLLTSLVRQFSVHRWLW